MPDNINPEGNTSLNPIGQGETEILNPVTPNQTINPQVPRPQQQMSINGDMFGSVTEMTQICQRLREENPWEGEFGQRVDKINRAFQMIKILYGLEGWTLRIDLNTSFSKWESSEQGSNTDYRVKTITLRGRISVITFLHEMAHAITFNRMPYATGNLALMEEIAKIWSEDWFRRGFPEKYAALLARREETRVRHERTLEDLHNQLNVVAPLRQEVIQTPVVTNPTGLNLPNQSPVAEGVVPATPISTPSAQPQAGASILTTFDSSIQHALEEDRDGEPEEITVVPDDRLTTQEQIRQRAGESLARQLATAQISAPAPPNPQAIINPNESRLPEQTWIDIPEGTVLSVGTRVRIKPDLISRWHELNSHIMTVPPMVELRGREATIINVRRTSMNLDIDRGGYNWTNGMLQIMAVPTNPPIIPTQRRRRRTRTPRIIPTTIRTRASPVVREAQIIGTTQRASALRELMKIYVGVPLKTLPEPDLNTKRIIKAFYPVTGVTEYVRDLTPSEVATNPFYLENIAVRTPERIEELFATSVGIRYSIPRPYAKKIMTEVGIGINQYIIRNDRGLTEDQERARETGIARSRQRRTIRERGEIPQRTAILPINATPNQATEPRQTAGGGDPIIGEITNEQLFSDHLITFLHKAVRKVLGLSIVTTTSDIEKMREFLTNTPARQTRLIHAVIVQIPRNYLEQLTRRPLQISLTRYFNVSTTQWEILRQKIKRSLRRRLRDLQNGRQTRAIPQSITATPELNSKTIFNSEERPTMRKLISVILGVPIAPDEREGTPASINLLRTPNSSGFRTYLERTIEQLSHEQLTNISQWVGSFW